MSKQTETSLFMVSSVPRLYQQLLSGVASYQALGNRLVKQIKVAHAFRQIEQVREIAGILANIPIKEYQLIGQYYLVWCNCRESVFKAEALEKLASQTHTYKAKVLLSRGAIEVYQHNMEAALYFYSEALKTSPSISEYISLRLGIAQVKGIEGFHQSALKDMENLIPIMRYAEPRLFFDLLNSYATELGAIYRLDEARNVSGIVLASPFIHAYPEWRETAEELKPLSRSFVAVISPDYNVLALPEREESEQSSLQPEPARVFNFARLRKKIIRKMKKQDAEKSVYQMDIKEMGYKLLELVTDNRASESQMRTLLLFALKVFYGWEEPSPPDDDKPAS